MFLIYFDENKFDNHNPYFWIGGVLVQDQKAIEYENILSQIQYNFFGTSILKKKKEFHGKELFHGKGQFKGKPLKERIQIFHHVSSFIINNKIPVRMDYWAKNAK
jgi:hypothetical protein